MISGLWGKKVGMTQIFADGHKVVPVTVIDVGNWLVTQVKQVDHDGYHAVQFGCIKPRHAGTEFAPEWLQAPRKYFSALREVRVLDGSTEFQIGHPVGLETVFGAGDVVDVSGITLGRGFQGVVKRYRHKGGRASHGDKLGRGPGSLTGMRTCGRVPKGRKLPGHMGTTNRTIKNLVVVDVQADTRTISVRGSVPGKPHSLVFVRKCREQ
jgi:large subunit ribosomal protein L3